MPTDRARPVRALLDVNVLIAHLDRDHVSHVAKRPLPNAHRGRQHQMFILSSRHLPLSRAA